MPDFADDGPDMLIHPCTKAFMARSVRRVFPLPEQCTSGREQIGGNNEGQYVCVYVCLYLPLGPQKMSKSVCSPNCSKLREEGKCQREVCGSAMGRNAYQ